MKKPSKKPRKLMEWWMIVGKAGDCWCVGERKKDLQATLHDYGLKKRGWFIIKVKEVRRR